MDSPTCIKVHIQRLYKGMVDLRSYIMAEAVKKDLPVIFTCDEFPGKQMTIQPSMLLALKNATSDVIRSKYTKGDTPEVYTLISYNWVSDGTEPKPLENGQQGSLF
jgi:hypothetical protein